MRLLTADEAVGAALRPVERPLHAGLEGLGRAGLLRVHGVDGAGRQRLGLAQAGVFGRGQLGGEGPHRGSGGSVLLGGQRQRLALGGRQGSAAVAGLGLLAVGFGFGEGARVEALLAVRDHVGAFGLGGDGRRHLDRSFRRGLEREEEGDGVLDDATVCAFWRGLLVCCHHSPEHPGPGRRCSGFCGGRWREPLSAQTWRTDAPSCPSSAQPHLDKDTDGLFQLVLRYSDIQKLLWKLFSYFEDLKDQGFILRCYTPCSVWEPD